MPPALVTLDLEPLTARDRCEGALATARGIHDSLETNCAPYRARAAAAAG